MDTVKQLRRLTGLTQAELAAAAGTSQPTIAAYEGGTKSPNLTTLRRLADAAGLDMTVLFHPRMTREDRRSVALHHAIAGKLMDDPDSVLRVARENLARMRSRHPEAGELLSEWAKVLERSVPEIVHILSDPGLRSRELRHVTPFGGVLTARERTEVYRRFAAQESEG